MASYLMICNFPGFVGHNIAGCDSRITWTKNPNAAIFYNSLSLKRDTVKLPCFKLNSHPAWHLRDNNHAPKKRVQVLSPDTTTPNLSIEILNAWNDEYNGLNIEPTSLPSSANAFASALRTSLSCWKSKGKKGIWLKLLEEQSELVPIAIQEGFTYHHAEPGYVTLTYWIPDEPCLLPLGPSHQIGIAGFVINDQRQILVVKEKCSCLCAGIWKLPTGYINKSEELFSGAVREVKEETGIDTRFLELVAFRHVHQVAFDQKSDLLFVCMLRPLSFEIKIDENEIQEAKWISVDELLKQEFYEEDEMSKMVIGICMETYESNYNGFIANQVISKFDGKLSYLYYQYVNIK